jgi:hypothetical protein
MAVISLEDDAISCIAYIQLSCIWHFIIQSQLLFIASCNEFILNGLNRNLMAFTFINLNKHGQSFGNIKSFSAIKQCKLRNPLNQMKAKNDHLPDQNRNKA